ncbi:MAG: formate/nitrite transporter family protein [Aquabacterium sp.]
MPTVFGLDAYAPREVAARVLEVGVGKARLPLASLLLLGVLAGAFIGLGTMAFTLVVNDATLGWAAQRLLGGLVFSLGLLLVSVAGAELFTGNNLIAMAWAAGRVSSGELLRNGLPVGAANAAGAAGLAGLLWLAGHGDLNGGAVGRAVVANLMLFPLAALLGAPLTLAEVLGNLVPVVAGNIIGGSVLVALVYWVIYLRPQAAPSP